MNEINYEELDPGIRLTVKRLRDNGFETTDSGDGKTKLLPGSIYDPTEVFTFPHVACVIDYEALLREATRLLHLLEDIGIIVRPIGYGDGNHPAIQASFDPSNLTAVIELLNVDDLILTKALNK